MIHLLIKMIDIDNIKKKLTPDLKHTETRIYFGKIISSFIFFLHYLYYSPRSLLNNLQQFPLVENLNDFCEN